MKLSHGSTRVVFIILKYSIKIPRFDKGILAFLDGWRSNILENGLFSGKMFYDLPARPPEDIRLCPIKYSFLNSFVLILPTCEVIPEPLDEEIYKKFCTEGGNIIYPENSGGSFGWLQVNNQMRRMVALDYGNWL